MKIDSRPAYFWPGVRRVDELPVAGAGPLTSCLLTLDNTPFDPALFALENVDRPLMIARSSPRRQAEFFFGRLAARIALSRCGVTGVDVWAGASREPVWPEQVAGSLTHCRGYAAAAVSRCSKRSAIGIDLEHLATGEALEALRAVVLDEEERRWIETFGASIGAPWLVTLAFSAKESLYKAAFPTVGRFFGFESAKLAEWRPRENLLTLRVTENLAPKLPLGRIVEVSYDMVSPDVLFTCVSW
jgi:enterobactin synthetase component D